MSMLVLCYECYNMLYDIILCCIILGHVTLCYIILCYVMLCYITYNIRNPL